MSRINSQVRPASIAHGPRLVALAHVRFCPSPFQIPLPQKLPYADHVIDNSGPLPSTSQSITHLVRSWRRESESFPGWWWCWVFPPLGLLRALWVLTGRAKRVERRKKNTRGAGRRTDEGETVELKVLGGSRNE
jgi:hypothetical protein